MTPLTIIVAIWVAGMLWQGNKMLGYTPEPIKDLFEQTPVVMFTCFIVALFICWPWWMICDIGRWVWSKWYAFRLRWLTKALNNALQEISAKKKADQ